MSLIKASSIQFNSITDKTRNKLVKGYDSYMYMFGESHTFTNLFIMYIRNYIHVYNELYIICKACNNNLFNSVLLSTLVDRAVARTLIGEGGGGVFIHIFMFCPTSFFSN